MNVNRKFWYKKNVFVTGAAGLLGGWLVKELLAQEAHVVCLIKDITNYSLLYTENLHTKITLVQGALEDIYTLERVLNEYDIDTVFHLGAQAIVSCANRSPLSTFKSNIEGTWNILESCRLSPWVKRVIVASSDKAYGDHDNLPYIETMALQGEHPYDVSKSCADLIARSYFVTYDVPVCITRCGNIFGGADFHFDRLIPGTIRSFLQNQAPLLRSDGLSIRDYIYVQDVVDAYMTLAENMDSPAIVGESFNISEELPKKVIDVVADIQNRMSCFDLVPIIQNNGSHEIKDQFLSCSKAKQLFNWQPKFGFDRGMTETIAWYTKYLTEKSLIIPAKGL